MVYSVPSLIPPASPPSLLEIEEAIEKVCREWRTRIQRLFDGMRRNLPVQSADTAAETGDSIQAHAIVKLLAGWNRAEKDSRNAIDTSKMKEKIRRLLSTGLSTKDIADCLICDELQFMERWIGVSSCGRNPGIERFLREIVVQKAKAIRPPGGKGGVAITVIEANQVAMNLAKLTSAFVGGGVRQWAVEIRHATGKTCSISTVKETRLWKETMKTTGRGRTRGKPPKAVGLTKNTEAVVGTGEKNEILNKLIAQQENDYEPSPLDAERSEASRKPKHYKRV